MRICHEVLGVFQQSDSFTKRHILHALIGNITHIRLKQTKLIENLKEGACSIKCFCSIPVTSV